MHYARCLIRISEYFEQSKFEFMRVYRIRTDYENENATKLKRPAILHAL